MQLHLLTPENLKKWNVIVGEWIVCPSIAHQHAVPSGIPVFIISTLTASSPSSTLSYPDLLPSDSCFKGNWKKPLLPERQKLYRKDSMSTVLPKKFLINQNNRWVNQNNKIYNSWCHTKLLECLRFSYPFLFIHWFPAGYLWLFSILIISSGNFQISF